VRRVAVVVVVALAAAVLAGALWRTSAISVNSSAISADTLRGELSAIAHSPGYQCYIGTQIALGGSTSGYGFPSGTTSYGFSPVGSASWTQLQVGGLAVEDFVVRQYHWSPSAADLAQSRAEYTNELAAGAAAARANCPVSAEAAVASMPVAFVSTQVRYYAASLELISHVPGAIGLDEASLHAYYDAHPRAYDTVCASIALVPPSQGSAFAHDQRAGASIEQLAKKYSVDASASSGGAIGCFAPGDPNYAAVRTYTLGQPVNVFPTTPKVAPTQSGEYLLYVAPTKLTPNSFEQASTQVFADVRSANASLAGSVQSEILATSHIAIDPAFAIWSASTTKATPLTTPTPALTPNNGTGLS
jgi:hypothetical protein